MVFDVEADREVDPLAFVGEGDTGGSSPDDFDLFRGADTRVEEHAGRGHDAGGEKDAAARLEFDNLPALGVLDLHAGHGGSVAQDSDDHGIELKFEGRLGLGQWQVCMDRSRT